MGFTRRNVLHFAFALVASLALAAGAAARQDDLSKSNDVARLEEVAGPPAAPGVEPAGARPARAGKGLRRSAYVRLGAIGTAESIAALKRVEARWREVVPAAPVTGVEAWAHPAWHFGDSDAKPLATVKDAAGVTYAVVPGTMMGSLDLFLTTSRTPDDKNSWTRPLLIPEPIYRGVSDPKLALEGDDTLRFTFTQGEPGPRGIMEGQVTPVPAAPKTGPQSWALSLRELRRDTDGDGWTDIEEQRLGLDPRRADTDGDGVADGRDVCPDYAPPAAEARDEEAQMIQRAFLALYGLSGSRHVLFVGAKSKRVQLWGYAGPILYGTDVKGFQQKYPEGYVTVSWSLKKKGADEAVVQMSDFEGPLAASGQDLRLKKIGGEWFVVENLGGWIS